MSAPHVIQLDAVSSSQATQRELLDYLQTNLGTSNPLKLDRDQIRQLLEHLCYKMGINEVWSPEFGDFLVRGALDNIGASDQNEVQPLYFVYSHKLVVHHLWSLWS